MSFDIGFPADKLKVRVKLGIDTTRVYPIANAEAAEKIEKALTDNFLRHKAFKMAREDEIAENESANMRRLRQQGHQQHNRGGYGNRGRGYGRGYSRGGFQFF